MTSYTYFISDLHLCKKQPQISTAFLHFVNDQAHKADALYILGDFFEAWVGDDDTTPLVKEVCDALTKLHQTGTPIYFMHGNRDFLIGHKFAKMAHLTLLTDPTVIQLYGKKIALTHGDYLCTDDKSHQRFRRLTNRPLIQRCFLALPLSWRQQIASILRNKSKATQLQYPPDPRYDVTLEAVTQLMQQHQVNCMIHGHTHKPATHDLTINQQPAQRFVLGAWENEAKIIRVDKDQTLHFETISITDRMPHVNS